MPFHLKPAKKSFTMVMFQRSASNLLHNVFCSFPNPFPKVSVTWFTDRKGAAISQSLLLEAGGKPKFVGRHLCIIFLGPGNGRTS